MAMVARKSVSGEHDIRQDDGSRDIVFQPLPRLLVSGGDDRLGIDPGSGLNVYGCSPAPRPNVLTFSSSTASSISAAAFQRAKVARDSLAADLSRPLADGFDFRVEAARRALKTYLGLNGSGAEVVFSASGTDSQLQSHYLTRMIIGGPLTSIVLASDQTGSGTVHTSRLRHFSNITALGYLVEKGGVAGEPADEGSSIGIALIRPDGTARDAREIDAEVLNAVGKEVAAGRKVLLQTMESSKLGWCAPSDACIDLISERWPGLVQIVADACQLRCGRARLRELLDRGAIVLITGSKFFMGPGFSGAALVPRALAGRLAEADRVPAGLQMYMSRSDVPARWTALRIGLTKQPNIGAWLRWEAALEEMGAYYALPAGFAATQFSGIGRSLAGIIDASRSLELLRESGGCPPDQADDEMPAQTVFAFSVKGRDGLLAHDDMVKLYRLLNRDLTAMLPAGASAGEQRLAAQLCHIGQPVKLGAARSVLRMALGARTVSQTWSQDSAAVERNTGAVLEYGATVVEKIELILRSQLVGS